MVWVRVDCCLYTSTSITVAGADLDSFVAKQLEFAYTNAYIYTVATFVAVSTESRREKETTTR